MTADVFSGGQQWRWARFEIEFLDAGVEMFAFTFG
jgi:hypothetical protein